MKKQHAESLKLGLFVLAGLVLLIVTLYVIGRNKGYFSNNFELKTHFRSVNGLLSGNNVRFAGIDVGSVKSVVLLNDTVVEVTMNVDNKMRSIIRRNACVYLGTDGLIGNKVVNIAPGAGAAAYAQEGDLIASREEISTDAMLQTLHHTNENIAVISEELRSTIHNIGNSAQLAKLLNDTSLSDNLQASLRNLRETTAKSSQFLTEMSQTLALASTGNGTLATILTDTTLAGQLSAAVEKIKSVEENADLLAIDLNKMVRSVDADLHQRPGTVNALMQDSLMADRLRNTMLNVEQGTAAFSQNMEALKHNFLFRKYFRKLEKQQKKNAGASAPAKN